MGGAFWAFSVSWTSTGVNIAILSIGIHILLGSVIVQYDSERNVTG